MRFIVFLCCVYFNCVYCTSCVKDVCSLPVVVGPCEAEVPRWASVGGKCQKFTYGGCFGNRNNFRSKEECKRRCPEEEEKDVCSLPVEVGPCRAALPRWASVDGKCQRFIYGGCRGNANNFRSKGECKSKCPEKEKEDVCSLPVAAGPCKAAFRRWAFRNGECQRFIYGGCRGNENNFKSKGECEARCREEEKDVCSLPVVVGPCDAAFPRWASVDGKCQQFTYGGCEGNANNFESKCPEKEEEDACSLPVVVGPCKAAFRRWASVDGECHQFTYGGCGGNANNFRTKEDCQKTCVKDVCSLPIEVGPCEALIPRWASVDGKCQKFTYGGCEGNANNFESKGECKSKCPEKEEEDVCSLPVVVGPCRAAFRRWAFRNGECQRFIYGGCRGNGNNFKTKNACENSCIYHE